MAENVLNINVYSPLKQRSSLRGNFHAICHYLYNFPFRHIQLVLNFCLPAASQLPHPKGMCLNAALNKIAFKTYRT